MVLDRSNCKKMWVWRDNKEDKEKRVVFTVNNDGSCKAVLSGDEEDFYMGEDFTDIYWPHYSPIK